jgi:anti-sigma regulatory factor (Ser/Thr protein kinase)
MSRLRNDNGAVPDPPGPSLAAVRLQLDSRPESLIVVRGMLAGVADTLAVGRERFDALRTAVSEACSNVVLHAYDSVPTGPGLLEVRLGLVPGELQVSVLDRGSGIRRIMAPGNRMRVGLALISALADRAEVLGRDDGGTEVRMAFSGVGRLEALNAPAPAPLGFRDVLGVPVAGEVIAEIAPPILLEGVLARVAQAIAARAHFTIDRHADVQLVCDELGAVVSSARGAAPITFAAAAGRRRLELRLGPLPTGSWERFRARHATGRGTALELLSDALHTAPFEGAETIIVALTDRRPRLPEDDELGEDSGRVRELS